MSDDYGDLRDLYQELILDHSRHPSNFRAMPDATRSVEGDNPLCGDHLRLYVHLEGKRIADISFQGSGCAISVASASLLTKRVKGKTVAAAEALFHRVHRLLTMEEAADEAELGELAALAGVRQFPMRVKCATLSWHALHAALRDEATEQVSTE
ncbi:MAG: SUF system NifU family Fe-S cluster assembly protein [Pseudomonadota bacterium]|nr:SUF system NifU family Fe-S cluster assembly protein [Pseudomonadota bacterium]